jgi:hypothetical protein
MRVKEKIALNMWMTLHISLQSTRTGLSPTAETRRLLKTLHSQHLRIIVKSYSMCVS